MIVYLLDERLKRRKPHTQDAVIRLGVLQVVADFQLKLHTKFVRPAMRGYVSGIIPDEWSTATEAQKAHWVDVAEQAYRESTGVQ